MGNIEYCCTKNNSIDNKSNLIQLSNIIIKSPTLDEGEISKTGFNHLNQSEQNNKINNSVINNYNNLKSSFFSDNSKENISKRSCKSPFHEKILSSRKSRRSTFFNRTYLNILIIGDRKVGKSSFSNLLKKNKFNENYNPSYEEDEKIIAKVIHNKKTYNFSFYIVNDINLIEKNYSKIIIDYYLIFYDLFDTKTIEFAKNIYINILKNKFIKINEKLSNIIFIRNKIDINTNLTNDSIIDFCKNNNLDHFDISVKENKGINELNKKLIEVFDINIFDNSK
jgi:GTPase SAR1 family protein